MKVIIPAIDVYGGKVVRLTRGDFSQTTVYSENPLELVKFFRSKGFKRIHLVDLEGAKIGEIKIVNLVRQIKEEYDDVIIQFGGGIRSYEVAKSVIDAGADFVIIGTMFIKKPEEFARVVKDFREKVILSLDINIDKIVIHGWQAESGISIEEAFDKAIRMGVLRIMTTDVARDGTLLGPDITFISNILDTIKKKYFDLLVEELMNGGFLNDIISESIETITKDVIDFMNTLKSPYSGSYELRQKIEKYDENLNRYKEAIRDNIPWDEIFKKYPKPLILISGGVSSDSDIDEIFKMDNSFLEGVIVGKSIYEGRLSIFG